MTLNDRLAAYFTEHPNVWIDGKVLAQQFGGYGWRSRVSDVRRERGMSIENRVRTFQVNGDPWKVSEYRYVQVPVTTEKDHEEEKDDLARVDPSEGQPFLLTAPTVGDDLERP